MLVQELVRKKSRILFIAHRRELVAQAADTLQTGNVICASLPHHPTDPAITVASLDTLIARKQWPDITHVIVDEAHHGPANKWMRLRQQYPDAVFIGLTATPVRSDGKPLGDMFDELIVGATTEQLTASGYLVPCEVFAPKYQLNGIAQLPEEVYSEHCTNKKTVAFTDLISSAERFRANLLANGRSCGLISGKLPAELRTNILRAYKRNDTGCIVNVGVLTEGWDDPAVTDCILARKCQSLGLYLQIVGRILRPAPGKAGATLWDLTGACRVHGLPGSTYAYSLSGEPIRCTDPAESIKQCLACGRAFINRQTCTHCGCKLGASKEEIRVKRAEMVRVFKEEFAESSPERKLDMMEKYLESMVRVANRHGYNQGWVYHRMIAKFPGHESIVRSILGRY